MNFHCVFWVSTRIKNECFILKWLDLLSIWNNALLPKAECRASKRAYWIFQFRDRRKIFYGQKRLEIGKILRDICEWQEVKIIEAEVCTDHIHMFVEIPPKLAV